MKKKLLYVYDASLYLNVFTYLVSRGVLNFEFIKVFGYDEAIKKITDEIPDVIVLELQSPFMDNLDLVYWLKENEIIVPVIIIYSGFNKRDFQEMEDAGCAGILTTPLKLSNINNKFFDDVIHKFMLENTGRPVKKNIEFKALEKSDFYYDKILWDDVWKKIIKDTIDKNWSTAEIIRQLSTDTNISEKIIFEFKDRNKEEYEKSINIRTRARLLVYLGYDSLYGFKKMVDMFRKKKIILALDNFRIKEDAKNIRHVFISYKKMDFDSVIRISDFLKDNGVKVWIDKESLMPGEDWQIAIQNAIENGMFFIACFSKNYWSNKVNYMNEELQTAVDQLRKMSDDHIWFLPIKLDKCDIPNFQIRQNKSLASKQFINLYEDWEKGMQKILSVIKK